MDLVTFAIAMLAVGACVGVMSAALGVGGGILMVPAFLYAIPGMDMNTAKGSSLLVIAFVAAYNSLRLNRGHMRTPWEVVIAVVAGSVVGGYVGGWTTSMMSDRTVTGIFVLLLFVIGVRMFFLKPRTVHEGEVRRRGALSALIGVSSGYVAGATGTGGGAVLVPMTLWAGIASNERIVAFSNTVMAATAAAGAAAHFFAPKTTELAWTYGMVDVALVPLVFMGAVVSFPLGRRINAILSFERRRIVMGVLLVGIAVRLLYRMFS